MEHTVVVSVLVVVGALLLAVLGLLLLAILLVGHGGSLGINLLLWRILERKAFDTSRSQKSARFRIIWMWTNQSGPVFRSLDHSRPIRFEYLGNVTCLVQ